MLLDLTDGKIEIVLLFVVPLCVLVGGCHVPETMLPTSFTVEV